MCFIYISHRTLVLELTIQLSRKAGPEYYSVNRLSHYEHNFPVNGKPRICSSAIFTHFSMLKLPKTIVDCNVFFITCKLGNFLHNSLQEDPCLRSTVQNSKRYHLSVETDAQLPMYYLTETEKRRLLRKRTSH